jgi:Na+-transporting methylmalonyl-CoA/oxaloacetate decarboxylase gamma subunit
MSLLLLQADFTTFNWGQFGMAAGAIFVVVVFLIFVLKIVPGLAATWERVRLAEIGVREKEAEARAKEAESRSEQANGFSQLAGALSQMSSVIHDVVVDQKHETDKAMLLMRANAASNQEAMAMVTDLAEDITALRNELIGEKQHDS